MCFYFLSPQSFPRSTGKTQRGCALNLSSLCTLLLSLFHSVSVLLSLTCGQGMSKPLVFPNVLYRFYLFIVSASCQTQVVCMDLWYPLAPHAQCLHKNHQRLPNQRQWTKRSSSSALGSIPEKKKKRSFLLDSNGFHLTCGFVMKFVLAILD